MAMIIGIGIDIVEVARIQAAIEKYGERFLERIYSETERAYSDAFNDNKYQHYAARFAAKESFSKAVGTGITKGFKFREICVENEGSGKPFVVLNGALKEKWGGRRILLSLSHTEKYAAAHLVIEEK